MKQPTFFGHQCKERPNRVPQEKRANLQRSLPRRDPGRSAAHLILHLILHVEFWVHLGPHKSQIRYFESEASVGGAVAV